MHGIDNRFVCNLAVDSVYSPSFKDLVKIDIDSFTFAQHRKFVNVGVP